MNSPVQVIMSVLLVFGVAGCGGGDALPDNDRLLEAFEQGRTGVWVSGHGRVTVVSGDATLRGVRQQQFTVSVDDGAFSLIVRHSLEDGERVPVSVGDTVAFQGRYEFGGGGGQLGRTHRDPDAPGEGGWIRHEGTLYD